jgi:glycerol kinase
MNVKYLLSIDQGTTGTRAILIDKEFNCAFSNYMEHNQIYPKPGWVEHDPMEIWNNTITVTGNVLKEAAEKGVQTSDILGIGIANQGETVMMWDTETGKPVYNAIVWQCRRSADMIEELKKVPGLEQTIQQKTGLILDSYFSAPKMKWIIDNVDGVKERIQQGKIAAGTLDSWLIWKMTGGKSFVTDCATASRTMILNINTISWDDDILSLLNIPKSILPDVYPNSGIFGTTDKDSFLGLTLPIAGSVVDQQGALFGQGCYEEGMVKNTYGTGCFMLMNIGSKPIISRNGLLTSIAWKIGDEVQYCFDGGIYIAGAAIQWLRDGLKAITTYPEADRMSEELSDTGGVYFVPAFVGLAAPYWDQYARGTMVGITGSTKREHIVRATLESIAYQVKNVIDSMEADYDSKIKMLRVDGGITKSDFLMQFQSDILGIPIDVPQVAETTALGAACFAGLAVGMWSDLNELKSYMKLKKSFNPAMDEQTRDTLMKDWNYAVKRSMHWENRDKEEA